MACYPGVIKKHLVHILHPPCSWWVSEKLYYRQGLACETIALPVGPVLPSLLAIWNTFLIIYFCLHPQRKRTLEGHSPCSTWCKAGGVHCCIMSSNQTLATPNNVGHYITSTDVHCRWGGTIFINPRCACTVRVRVLGLCVCLSVKSLKFLHLASEGVAIKYT